MTVIPVYLRKEDCRRMLSMLLKFFDPICPWAWVLIINDLYQFRRAKDQCHYSSFVEQYYISFESNLILFTAMQKNHCFKIKTINLDSEVFTQEININNKLTVPLIRNLTQRKNREYKKFKADSHQKLIKNSEKQESVQTEQNYFDHLKFNQNEGHFDHFAEFDNEFLKRHTKTNPSNQKRECITERKSHFKRYNHSHSHAMQGKNEDPQLFFQTFQKNGEENQNEAKEEEKQSPRATDRVVVNPYTNDQYIYMRNRKIDELMQLKRSGKMTRTNSITKSYRVAPISLTPQISRRANSFKLPIPQPPNKGKHRSINNASFFRNFKKQSEIKPWQWTGAEESKQYLM